MKRFLYLAFAAFALCCCSAEDGGAGVDAFFSAELVSRGELPAKEAVAKISVTCSSAWNGRLDRVEGESLKGIRFLRGEGTMILDVPLPDNTGTVELEYLVRLSCPDVDGPGEEFRLVQLAEEDTPPGPGPGPSTDDSQPGWYELPKMNIAITSEGNYKYNSEDNTQYYAWRMCSGGETGPGGKTARNYTVCFSAEHHCPLWVAAPLHSMYKGDKDRSKSYRTDPLVPPGVQYSENAAGSDCNRGHMLGSSDRNKTEATNKDVFYFTNIAPQLSANFNNGGGRWNRLEEFIDTQFCPDTLYAVIGCYFDDYTDSYGETQYASKITFGGRTDVSMPTMFYYVVLRTKSGNSGRSVKDCSASELMCAAFVRAHVNVREPVSSKEMMSVSDLEKITGVTYFANVPNAPKDSFTASDWGL